MKKRRKFEQYDQITRGINGLLLKIPKIGSAISRLYLWRYTMINVMIVGATGTIIYFLLYEGFFRRMLIIFWGGTFLATVICVILIFFWNYLWNKHWSLSVDSQLYSMTVGELNVLKGKIEGMIKLKFEANPDDLHHSSKSG